MAAGKKGQQKGTKENADLRSDLFSFCREMLLVFGCVLLVNSFVMASFKVPTGSMENTVESGDFLFVNKFLFGGTTPYSVPLTSIRIPHLRVPGLRDIKRGDVIVFDWPGSRDQVEKPPQVFYLKRCIALPGDVIRIDQRAVYVNSRKQTIPPKGQYLRLEPMAAGYANPSIFPRASAFNEDNYGPVVVPKKGLVLSLNAGNFAGWEVFIRREGHSAALIEGQVLIDGKPTADYTVERDYVFGMGDNRDNSLDSRFWGFIPVENVIGTPMMVYWSWDPNIPLSHPIDKILSIRLGRIGTIIR